MQSLVVVSQRMINCRESFKHNLEERPIPFEAFSECEMMFVDKFVVDQGVDDIVLVYIRVGSLG